ncbi:Leucine-rich repeat-containing protein 43 [Heterocephalus glaber]|uniref:Leucine-rich repeat-containing protein 43 n=1 Tax=Heterocephalus glaber TaxID=10181 RepID=G5AWQ4_HETGA|nr:Leucine-rich repeat-containing protein 43 [Heterocephalus glaber]
MAASAGSESAPGTVSSAVKEHLRQLCLCEFPCGTGSWNRSRFLPPTRRAWKKLVPGEEAAVGPGEELVEALLDLVRSPQSLWALPEDSSAEDRFLRELAIQSPLMIRDTFFYSYFRSLRVVGKQVSQVGGDLLKFLKLEELVLSANRIKEVDAANLPPMLKVLELYGNELSSTECLCAHPPPGLQHLGLGQNQLRSPSESRYLTASHWPNLVSLDLGFNDLTDLRAMVAALRSLGRLRLLVLQGNPLALLPHYRGFTVDSLARLCVLDDVTVSPHERHQFRGLGQQGDLLPQDAQLVVTVGNIRGVVDSSVLDPEPGPKGPFVAYSYYVTYDFLGGEDGEASEHGGVLAEVVKPRSSAQLLGEELAEDLAEESLASVETTEQKSESSVVSGCSAARPPFSASGEELGKLRPRMDPRLCPSPGTVPFSTDHKPWANVIACNYEAQHSIRDLGLLKGFLLAGTTVTIMEEKGAKKGKGEDDKKKKEKDRKDWKGKAEEPPQERKASHKKREAPKELCQDPPTLQALGSGLVALEPLLAGEAVVSTVCNFGVIRTPESDRLTFARVPWGPAMSLDLHLCPPHRGLAGQEGRGDVAATSVLSGTPGPGRPWGEKTKSAAPIFESDYQPEQLTVEVEIQLGQVRSVEEALRAVANQARAE